MYKDKFWKDWNSIECVNLIETYLFSYIFTEKLIIIKPLWWWLRIFFKIIKLIVVYIKNLNQSMDYLTWYYH